MNAVSVSCLRRSFGGLEAVKGVSFDVPEGSFFAFLGPNGAGKSTTISMICGLLEPDSGSAEVFGRPASDPSARRDVGVVFQEPMMDARLTVRENLALRGSLYGLSGAELDEGVAGALRAADATGFADRRYGELSGGMRRRADIARALVHRPRLLLLDEPTAGLDPRTRKAIWDSVLELDRGSGLTVLLTTHHMEEAAGADGVVVIDRGEVVARGTPASLKEAYGGDRMSFVPTDAAEAERALEAAGVAYTESKGTISVALESTLDAVPLIGLLDGLMESL